MKCMLLLKIAALNMQSCFKLGLCFNYSSHASPTLFCQNTLGKKHNHARHNNSLVSVNNLK